MHQHFLWAGYSQWSWETEMEVWLQRGHHTCIAFVWQQREFGGPETMTLFIRRFVAGNVLGIWAGSRKTSFHFCRSVRAMLLRRPCVVLAAVPVRSVRQLSAAALTLPRCWCCWLACLCVCVLPLCTGTQWHLCMLLSVHAGALGWS